MKEKKKIGRPPQPVPKDKRPKSVLHPDTPLTKRQEEFCRQYLIDLNGTQAAIRAGYSTKGAHVQAAQLLSNPKVQSFANKLKADRSERTEITADMVLKEIGRLAFADIRSLFDENGRLLPVHMLPPEVAASIASIEVVTSKVPGGEPVEVEHTAKVKFWDKRGSLELLGRHLKMFTDKIEHSGKIGLESLIAGDDDGQ